MASVKEGALTLSNLKAKTLSLCPKKENDEKVSTSTRKRKVLDEESYTDALEKIIQRDFYPDFEKLKAQNEYLEALESNDVAKLREIQIKYCSRRATSRPGTSFSSIFNTPSTFETPRKDDGKSSGTAGTPSRNPEAKDAEINALAEANKVEEGAKLLTLDQFLYKFTSEDNASFDTIMVEAAKKHQLKYPWLYHDENNEESKIQNALALPSSEKLAINDNKPKELTTWTYKNENFVMYVPKGVELTFDEKLQKEQRREVVHSNTRFETQPFNETVNKAALAEAASVQAKTLEGKIGIDGKELIPKDTPTVNGYGFVASTPSPAPGVMDSPLMTWGEIEGTPFRLDGSDTPIPRTPGGPQFKIPDVPSRERLALALADKASKQSRTKKEDALKKVKSSFFTPSPQFGATSPSNSPLDRKLNRMSPAAQRLACAKLGIHRSTDKALLASYTPSPSRTPLRDHTPTGSPSTPKTPVLKRKLTDPSSLTDNLLNLSDLAKSRTKAADYF